MATFLDLTTTAKTIILQHKVIAIILIAIFASGGYVVYGKVKGTKNDIRYVLASVEKGTLTSSVSGSGQISVSNQVDIKSKASGDIIFLGAIQGQEVKTGALLVQLDTRDAAKAVRDAQSNVASAKLSLQKLKKPADKLAILQSEDALAQAKRELDDLLTPPDALSLLQAEHAVEQAKESNQKAKDTLQKSYDDGFNTISNAFLDLPNIVTSLNTMLFNTTIENSQQNIDWYANQMSILWDPTNRVGQYRDDLRLSYIAARKNYDTNLVHYQDSSRSSDSATIQSLISETYTTTKLVADTVKKFKNYIDFVKDQKEQHSQVISSVFATQQTLLDGYTSKTNAHLSNLLSSKQNIQDDSDTIVNTARTIAEKTQNLDNVRKDPEVNTIKTYHERIREKEESLLKLKAGADTLDVTSQELTIRQRENALLDAQEKRADYVIRAPFDGVVATMDLKKGDSLSSNSTIARLVTKQHIAEISLNEVDVSKIKVGQKAVLTLDAIQELSISGHVAEIDTIGTTSQGVVSYTVKISLDTQDDRIKPGMSVSAAIITNVKSDVLMVSNAALKTQGAMRYVQVPSGEAPQNVSGATGVLLSQAPRRQAVEIGIVNDEFTEIVSGLNDKELIITSTINTNAKTTSSTQTRPQSGSPIPGLPSSSGGTRGGGGGGFR